MLRSVTADPQAPEGLCPGSPPFMREEALSHEQLRHCPSPWPKESEIPTTRGRGKALPGQFSQNSCFFPEQQDRVRRQAGAQGRGATLGRRLPGTALSQTRSLSPSPCVYRTGCKGGQRRHARPQGEGQRKMGAACVLKQEPRGTNRSYTQEAKLKTVDRVPHV